MVMTNQNASDPIAVPAQLLVREVWSRGDLALVDELVINDYVEQEIEVDGVFISDVTGGRLLKGTDVWNAFGLLRQLEAFPELMIDRIQP